MLLGRELPDLARVFPELDLFDHVVAENGALLFEPATKKESPLAPKPPGMLVETLRRKGVTPLSVGRSIIATWEPNEKLVLEVIHELGLELQIVLNKGAVMVLPPGVNKASGLKAALADLGLSAHNVVSIGDAENDHERAISKHKNYRVDMPLKQSSEWQTAPNRYSTPLGLDAYLWFLRRR